MSGFSEFWRNFVSPTGPIEVETQATAKLANGETIVMTGKLTIDVLKAIAEEKDVRLKLEEGQTVTFNLYEINSHIADKVLDFFDKLPADGTKGTLEVNTETGEGVYKAPTSLAQAFTAESNYKLKRKGLPKVEVV